MTTHLATLARLRLDDLLPAIGRVLQVAPGDARRAAGQAKDLVVTTQIASPALPLLAALRRLRPRLSLKGIEVRTEGADVLATLADDTAFTVAPYAAVMRDLAGPFALALDGEEHRMARARLDAALAPVDVTALGRWADGQVEALVAMVRDDGRIDVVGDLAEPLVTGFVAEHLGVPEPPVDPTRPRETLVVWAGQVFEACFLNLARDRVVHAHGVRGAERLKSLVREALHAWRTAETERDGDEAGQERGGGATAYDTTDPTDGMADTTDGTAPDTVLTRLAAEQRDEEVVTDLVGLLVGAIPTVAESVARVVDHLMRHDDRLEGAVAAAGARDRERLWQIAQECLRFDPQSPALLRAPGCPVTGEPRAVLVSTLSAMHDPALVPEPGRYRPGRAETAYLHFGHGPHRCPGAPHARELIVSAVGGVLREPGLAEITGRLAEVSGDGPIVRSRWVRV